MKKTSFALAVLLASSFITFNAQAATIGNCPVVGAATSCAVVYTFNGDGSVTTTTNSSIQSTDGIEDTLVGVVNNSGKTLDSFTLNGGSLDIFGFDGDGMSTVPNPGSGPGDTYFGYYSDAKNKQIGTVTFKTTSVYVGDVLFPGLTDGGTAWFVLEEQIDFTKPPVVVGVPASSVPENDIYAMMLAGLGLVGLAARRRQI
ncbi:MAG TPA: PEP-CTERM sorting domain-containing protein [Methylophilaceae bacterium]|jgi:hypothetical protein